MTTGEVKLHLSIDRFLVVFHSPTGMVEERRFRAISGNN
jgi:hypothetical protein